ncbi:MAG: hypothetical protein ACI8T1_004072 [Verrucomicrobiales bacterium]|jgi:hypothetical protein
MRDTHLTRIIPASAFTEQEFDKFLMFLVTRDRVATQRHKVRGVVRTAGINVSLPLHQVLHHLQFAAMRRFPEHGAPMRTHKLEPMRPGFQDLAHSLKIAACCRGDTNLQKVTGFPWKMNLHGGLLDLYEISRFYESNVKIRSLPRILKLSN